VARFAIAVMIAYSTYVTVRLAQPEIQAASDRICVPLYNETGLECCQ
jgi:hypothetical protein